MLKDRGLLVGVDGSLRYDGGVSLQSTYSGLQISLLPDASTLNLNLLGTPL